MSDIWDKRADAIKKGDNIRKVLPKDDRTWIDEVGFTHYVFNTATFQNPWYSVSEDDFKLFQDFVRGGSRPYPSDGSIPCDIVAREARKVLNKLEMCSINPNHHYCQEAKNALKYGKFNLVRGTLKLYLGKYTTRDWRRKRFTDDIDFWMFQTALLDSTLKECGFSKNKVSGEWEKAVHWKNLITQENRNELLFAANNLNQLLDFGAGAYLEGASLKEIFDKKIKRGHDVDLSDIINVAMLNDGIEGKHKVEWNDAWSSFEEAANTRNSRTTSNLISLCRFSHSMADYFEKIARLLNKYSNNLLDEEKFTNEDINQISRISIHWQEFLDQNGVKKTRKMLEEFYQEQSSKYPSYAQNLRNFAGKVLKLLNSKYEYLNIIFEIES